MFEIILRCDLHKKTEPQLMWLSMFDQYELC